MPDTYGYKHTLRICNTAFPRQQSLHDPPLNVTLHVHCQSCFSFNFGWRYVQTRWWKSAPPMLSHSNFRSLLCSHTQKGGLLGIRTAIFGYRTDLFLHT